LLRGAEVVIEQEDVGVARCGGPGDLLKLTRTDQRCRIDPVAPLQDFSDYFGSGAFGQSAQLGERLGGIELGNGRFHV
jgi:hypothetical protein